MGIDPNYWIFLGLLNISQDRVLFDSFDPLNFVHWDLYFTHENIMCFNPFCYITSQSSGRTKSPVILPTILSVFLSTVSCEAK